MGDQNKTKDQGQSQTGGQAKGTTQVGTHGNQGGSQDTGYGQGQTSQPQGTSWDDRSPDETYGEQGRQNQGQPNPQSQGNMGNTTKDPMGDRGTGANTRPTNNKR